MSTNYYMHVTYRDYPWFDIPVLVILNNYVKWNPFSFTVFNESAEPDYGWCEFIWSSINLYCIVAILGGVVGCKLPYTVTIFTYSLSHWWCLMHWSSSSSCSWMWEPSVRVAILMWLHIIWIVLDNIRCEGDDLFEEAEQCHYSQDYRDECAAPVSDDPDNNVVPINNNSEVICTCKFRDGQRVCADC